MKTRLLSILLLLCMIVTAIPAVQASAEGSIYFSETVSAAEHALADIPEPSELPSEADRDPLYLAPSAGWAYEYDILNNIERDLIAAIREGKKSIDVSKYNIDANVINLNVVQYFSPYLSNGINVTSWYNSGKYVRLDVDYTMSENEINAHFAAVDARIAEIDAILNTASEDLDMALLLHDYLAYTGKYDYDNYINGTIPADSYRSAGILVNGVGVCQSYAYAFKYFMHRKNIECHVVSSKAMNHAWNMIKLGDSYYHIDVTWDDPTLDKLGQVKHDHFLVSDGAFRTVRGGGDKAHTVWDTPDFICSDTRYDNAYWYGINSPIYHSGAFRFYIKNNGIVRRDGSGSETEIMKLGIWPTWDGNGYWIGSFSGLWFDNGDLYYNTATEFRRIEGYTTKDVLVYKPNTENGYIFGCAVKDGVMSYVLNRDPNTKGEIYSVPLHELTKKEAIFLDKNFIALEKGESVKLTATPVNSSATTVGWYSADTTVATVSADGTVSAVGEGNTYIKAVAAGGTEAKCAVSVTDPNKVDSSEIFRDVKASAWFKEAVDHAVGNGLMNGTSKDCFEPNAPMNRAMLVTVLWRLEGSPTPEREAPFTDLKQDWYRDAVAWAYSREIVNGTTDTTFSPSKSITREQMAAILYRYSAYKGYDTTNRAELVSYPDASRISPYAVLSMSWANGTGLITGKPSNGIILLVPRGNATRAEVATILMRYFGLYNL